MLYYNQGKRITQRTKGEMKMETVRELVRKWMGDIVEVNVNGEITNDWEQYADYMVDEYDSKGDILYIWIL